MVALDDYGLRICGSGLGDCIEFTSGMDSAARQGVSSFLFFLSAITHSPLNNTYFGFSVLLYEIIFHFDS